MIDLWDSTKTDLIIDYRQMSKLNLLIREYLENKATSKCRLPSESLSRLGLTQLPAPINFTVMSGTLHHRDKFLKIY